MMDDIMLKVDHVSKVYKLGQIGSTTLRNELQRKLAIMRGEEDPTTKIGRQAYEKGETFKALDDISFTVKKGERIGVIGHNGAGKSTLLKLISHITTPTEGTISMNGRVASMLEVGTGFHAELTGRENIYMNGAILGMKKKEIDSKLEQIIDFSEVRQFIDTPVKRYSSGMYVKLAFSVAAYLDSEIVIMDEVLAVGDIAFQQKCLQKIREVSESESRTVLYVSHNMATIRQLCDRCIVLKQGRIVYDGDVEEAIGIYLGNYSSDSLIYDFSNTKRKRESNYKCRLQELKITGRTNNVLKRGEPLKISLSCQINEDMEDLRFRIEMMNMEGDKIGTSFSDRGIRVFKGTNINVHLTIDTTNFAPGSFHASILPYERDSSGNQVRTDWVDPAFFISVTPNDEDIDYWNQKNYGSIRLPDIEVTGIEERE